MFYLYLAILQIVALALTIVFETAFAFASGYRTRQTLRVVVVAQVATNPLVVFISNLFYLHTMLPLWSFQLPLEIAAVIAEWLIYRRFAPAIRRPLVFSIAANAVSFGLGLILQYLGAFNWIARLFWG